MKKRKISIYSLLTLAGFTVGWGLLEPYWLQVKQELAYVPHLPTAWRHKKIAVMGDFHVGMKLPNLATFKRAVRLTIAERPAAVFLTGDYLYISWENLESQIETCVEILRPLIEADIPVYTVFGNHDYGMEYHDMDLRQADKEQLAQALANAGVVTLQNEVVPLKTTSFQSDETLYLVAIGSAWADNDLVEETISQMDQATPRLVLMHNPDAFPSFPAYTAPFAVAGHTHGGQIRIPFTPPGFDWLRLVDEVGKKGQGWAESEYGQAGNRLYINRGIGFSSIPMRIACRPELTIFTLEQGSYQS